MDSKTVKTPKTAYEKQRMAQTIVYELRKMGARVEMKGWVVIVHYQVWALMGVKETLYDALHDLEVVGIAVAS